MKRNHRLVSGAALLLLATVLAAGCGKTKEPDSPAADGGDAGGPPKVSDASVTLNAAVDSVIVDRALEAAIQDGLKKKLRTSS